MTSGSDDDGTRERKVNTSWRLDDRGVFSDSHGELLTTGLGWQCGPTVGSVHQTGAALPFKIRDIPVAPDINRAAADRECWRPALIWRW